jgi:hypothetical protein
MRCHVVPSGREVKIAVLPLSCFYVLRLRTPPQTRDNVDKLKIPSQFQPFALAVVRGQCVDNVDKHAVRAAT